MSGSGTKRSGTMDIAKGRAKKAAGDLTGNEQLKQEGAGQELAGQMKRVAGEGQERIEKATDRAKAGVEDLKARARKHLR
jgi:uncharacterized protein YjbJ (UPF0337 family)